MRTGRNEDSMDSGSEFGECEVRSAEKMVAEGAPVFEEGAAPSVGDDGQLSGGEFGEDEYDLIVIGAGPTGENLAERAHAGGLRVAVVEHELVGGECSYWACMPSKALLRPVAALADARRVAGAREAVTGVLDNAAVLARRDDFVSHWKDDGQAAWLDTTGIHLVRGHGRLDGVRRVAVRTSGDADGTGAGAERILHARHAVAICTGSKAALPH